MTNANFINTEIKITSDESNNNCYEINALLKITISSDLNLRVLSTLLKLVCKHKMYLILIFLWTGVLICNVYGLIFTEYYLKHFVFN